MKTIAALALALFMSASQAAPVYVCKVNGEITTIELRENGKLIDSWSVDTWMLTALKLC